MRSNLKTESSSVTGSAGSASTSATRLNRTESPVIPASTLCHTCPPATTSNSMPGCARSTRIRCDACSPAIKAVASSQVSAIHRRRVTPPAYSHRHTPFETSPVFTPFVSIARQSAPKSIGGTLIASPRCVADVLLLFLRGLLGCLLRALLSCLFCCHVFYSPFSMSTSKSAT